MTDVASALNEFIAVCRDEQQFYEEAAQEIDRPELRDFFLNMAQLREEAIAELAAHVQASDAPVRTSGTLAGGAERLFAQVQVALARDHERTLIDRLQDAESRSLRHLKEIAAQQLPPAVESTLRRQIERFESARSQIEALQRATR